MCSLWFIFWPAAIPDSQLRPEILGGKPNKEDIKNTIPETIATPPPLQVRRQPFDYDEEVYVGPQTEERKEKFPGQEEEEEEENLLNPRGDVFGEFLFSWDIALILTSGIPG